MLHNIVGGMRAGLVFVAVLLVTALPTGAVPAPGGELDASTAGADAPTLREYAVTPAPERWAYGPTVGIGCDETGCYVNPQLSQSQ